MALHGQYIEEKIIKGIAFFEVNPPRISVGSDRADIVETILSFDAMPAMRDAHIFSFPKPMGVNIFEGKYAINSRALILMPENDSFIIPSDHKSILDSMVIVPARFKKSPVREHASNIMSLTEGGLRGTTFRTREEQFVLPENILEWRMKKRKVNRYREEHIKNVLPGKNFRQISV